MSPQIGVWFGVTPKELHIALILVLLYAAILANRIYFKHCKTFGPDVSAGRHIRPLIQQGNQDGWLATTTTAIGVSAASGILWRPIFR